MIQLTSKRLITVEYGTTMSLNCIKNGVPVNDCPSKVAVIVVGPEVP